MPARFLLSLLAVLTITSCSRAPDSATSPAAPTAQAAAAAAEPAHVAAVADSAPAQVTRTGSATSDGVASSNGASADAGTTSSGGWQYADASADGGIQHTASITGQSKGGPATLVFRDDSVWGRSAYLQISQDAFECPTGCKVQISVDGGTAKTVLASRPETTEPRLSLREPRELWQSLAAARSVSIDYPTRAAATDRAEFNVAGLDAGKLPGWK